MPRKAGGRSAVIAPALSPDSSLSSLPSSSDSDPQGANGVHTAVRRKREPPAGKDTPTSRNERGSRGDPTKNSSQATKPKISRRGVQATVKDEAALTTVETKKLPSRGRSAKLKGKDIAKRRIEADTKVELEEKEDLAVKGKGRSKKTKARNETKVETDTTVLEREVDGKQKGKATSTVTKKRKRELEEAEEAAEETIPKPKRRRKTKEEKEAEAMPLAPRTVGLKMYIGAHVSSAKGAQNAVTNSVHIGGNGFALFLKSQRKWQNPALNPDHASQFKQNCKEHGYDAASHVVPHGSYLVNLAQKDPDRATQAYDCFLEDLQRCETLGIGLYNFHPGTTGPHPRAEAIGRIAGALNRAHRSTSRVRTVLENMAGRGNVIGARFEDLRDIIALVDDKSRVGVCLDTCHAFAAGYDLRTPETFKATLTALDATIGLRYLSALHINDSKAPFGAHRDLHQNIGLGFLGLRAFHNVVNEPRFEGLPMVLETPIDRDGKEDKGIWAREIKLLESLIGMDVESSEFLEQESRLADEGREERDKHLATFERKIEKERKQGERKAKKGKKKGKVESEVSEESEGGEESDDG